MEVLIIRSKIPHLFNVVLADFNGDSSKVLADNLDFDEAVEIRKEYNVLYNIRNEEEAIA